MNHPYHFEAPPAYQVKKSFDHFTLYLNIDSHNIIEGFFFTGPAESPWIPVFSELCHLCEGQRLTEDFLGHIPLSSPVTHWNLPLWLLRQASREFFQIIPPHNQLVQERAEDLICRCFGVYLPQILPFNSLKEVTNETRAGGGCTRCRHHIEAILGTSNAPDDTLPQQDFNKIKELTAVFIKNNFPSCTLKLTGVRGSHIQAIFSGEQNQRDKVIPSVEKLIAYNFQLDVTLSISDL